MESLTHGAIGSLSHGRMELAAVLPTKAGIHFARLARVIPAKLVLRGSGGARIHFA